MNESEKLTNEYLLRSFLEEMRELKNQKSVFSFFYREYQNGSYIGKKTTEISVVTQKEAEDLFEKRIFIPQKNKGINVIIVSVDKF